MSVETALYPPQLNTAWPLASDMVSEGDDHIRLLKTVFKTTFPNVAGAINATDVQINFLVGVTSPLQSQIDGKGSITGQNWSGPHVFGGSIAVPTLAQATSTTGAASTAFVQNEWATRLPNYTGPITASTAELNRMVGVTSGVQSQINTKGAIGGQVWTGTHAFPNTTTIGPLTPTIQGYLATATSDIQAQINAKASNSGEIYTGTHNFTGATVNVATAATGSAGSAAASLDFVNATALSSALPGQAGNAGKVITTNGTNASWSNVLTSYLSGPAGATGTQFPQAQEVIPRLSTLAGSTNLRNVITSGFNRITTYTGGPAGVDLSFGQMIVSRGGGDTIFQMGVPFAEVSGPLVFRRGNPTEVGGPGDYGAWQKFVTSGWFVETVVSTELSAGTSAYSIAPNDGSIHHVKINDACTFNFPTPRQLGDQVTLRVESKGGVRPITFSANVRLPVGSLPTYTAGQIITFAFVCSRAGIWDLFRSEVHAV